MASGSNKTRLSPEEYRRALLLERRRVMRTVRNTLLGIAIIAALWFVALYVIDKRKSTESPPEILPEPLEESAPVSVKGTDSLFSLPRELEDFSSAEC